MVRIVTNGNGRENENLRDGDESNDDNYVVDHELSTEISDMEDVSNDEQVDDDDESNEEEDDDYDITPPTFVIIPGIGLALMVAGKSDDDEESEQDDDDEDVGDSMDDMVIPCGRLALFCAKDDTPETVAHSVDMFGMEGRLRDECHHVRSNDTIIKVGYENGRVDQVEINYPACVRIAKPIHYAGSLSQPDEKGVRWLKQPAHLVVSDFMRLPMSQIVPIVRQLDDGAWIDHDTLYGPTFMLMGWDCEGNLKEHIDGDEEDDEDQSEIDPWSGLSYAMNGPTRSFATVMMEFNESRLLPKGDEHEEETEESKQVRKLLYTIMKDIRQASGM